MIAYPSSSSAPAELPPITSSNRLMEEIRLGLQGGKSPASASSSGNSAPFLEWLPGTSIRFGEGAAGNRMLVKGWSHPEPGYTWSDGVSAEMLIPNYPRWGPSLLKFELTPFCYASGGTQNVRVSLGNRLAGVWDFAGQGSACLIVPRQEGEDSSLRLSWEFPNAKSPHEIGMNPDRRRLAVALLSVSLYSLRSMTAAPLAHN